MSNRTIHADDSWRALVEKVRGFVARHAPRDEVDDVVQDVLLRIHVNLAHLKDSERLGPWVFRIARNALIDRARARASTLNAGAVPVDDDVRALSLSLSLSLAIDDAAEEDDVQRGLVACIAPFVARLPAGTREAVVLTELEGLTQEAAASMLGISLSGAKSRVQRGRRRLRAMFEECCALTQDARGHVVDCAPLGASCGSCAPVPSDASSSVSSNASSKRVTTNVTTAATEAKAR